ncbi:MAG TPA: hypothetical protein VN455_12030 [Methanotrichaceae archaeon]|nr:hypothetical protein [Methanotrichaceae archaeon]
MTSSNPQRDRDIFISWALAFLFFLGYYLSIIYGPHPALTIGIAIGLFGLMAGVLNHRYGSGQIVPSWRANPSLFALVTIVFYLITKVSSLLLHEWSHSTVAYLLGVTNKSPLDIYYGTDWTFRGMTAINDTAVYSSLMASGSGVDAGMIFIAGPLMNVFLSVIALALLFWPRARQSSIAFFFIFWAALHNVSQVWSYIPIRSVLYDGGDVYYFETALGISPWLVTAVGTAMLTAAFAILFISVFPSLCIKLRLAHPEKAAIFALAWFTAFVWNGLFPLILSGAGFGGRVGIVILEVAVGIGMFSNVIISHRHRL